MENNRDAFIGGIISGGLNNQQEIRILICYMLDAAGQPMPGRSVRDIIYGGGMANYFETEIAITELLEKGNIKSEEDNISITEAGRQIAATLSYRIPAILREQSVKAALQLLSRIRRMKDSKVDIAQSDNGCGVTCTIADGDKQLMSLSLNLADDIQAGVIRDHFLENPSLLYRTVLALLTGDYAISKEDGMVTFPID